MRQALEDAHQLTTLRMINGEMLERIHDCHRIPAHRPSPNMEGLSGYPVAPTLLSAFIPCMMKKSSVRIASPTLNQQDLVRHLIKGCCTIKYVSILCQERGGHVYTIQPHLVRINFLV